MALISCMKRTEISIKKICLSLSTLTFASTQILLFTLFPLLAEKLSLSLAEVVASFSLGTFLFLWGSPYWSAKSDQIGRAPVMLIGLFGLSFSFAIIAGLIHFGSSLSSTLTLPLLILSRVIYGLCASSIVPVAQLIRSEMGSDGEHVKNMFGHSLTLSLGRSIGPILLLLFSSHLELLLLIVTLWSLLLLVFHWLTQNKPARLSSHAENPPRWREITPEIIWPLLITILFTSYTGVLHSTLGGVLQTKFSLTSIEASTLMAKVLLAGSLVMAVTQLIGKFVIKNHLKTTLFTGLTSLSLGAVILSSMNQSHELWISISFISLGIALIHPSNLALLHLGGSKNLGKKVGLLSSGNTIGYALGGTLASIFLGINLNILIFLILLGLVGASIMSCKKVSL